MKPTNYHLFDFLDFDPELKRDESLWKAYKPTSVYERDGDIYVVIPFQKQVLANDMEADMSVAQVTHTLIIRMYEPKIIRIFIDCTDGEKREKQLVPNDNSDILQFSQRVRRMPLHLEIGDNCWTIKSGDGIRRAFINNNDAPIDHWSDLQPAPQPTIDICFYPDGQREVRLAAYDHFSPPRYDALPIAFCKTGNCNNRATLSFECKADECFAGTGERFMKMDLSGQTFFLKNQDGQGVNNRRTYKNIPFYLSSHMYGTFYHTTAHSKLSLAGHSTRSVQFLSDQAIIDAFIIGGDESYDLLFR